MINKERLIENLISMIKIDSVSFEEEEFRKFLITYFKAKGFNIYTDNAGKYFGSNSGNLLIHINGSNKEEPLCLAAHLDTVSPGKIIEPFIFDGVMKSRGDTILAGDDKAGIAAIIEAIEHVMEEHISHRELYLLFTICEEVGMLGIKNFDITKLNCKNVVFIDAAGPSGIIAYEAPAKDDIRISFKGRKSHAGIEPEKGINAIYIAADAISNMNLGRIDYETTANIGRIEGGGATNIVSDDVFFTAEVRSHSMNKIKNQIDHMEVACKNAVSKFNGEYKMEVTRDYPALKLNQNSFVFNICKSSFETNDIVPLASVIGGGSDANILSEKGYECAIISVGMENVHTTEEKLNVEELMKTTRSIVTMISL